MMWAQGIARVKGDFRRLAQPDDGYFAEAQHVKS
jgi:hypothetical protein